MDYEVNDFGIASFKYIKNGFKGELIAYGQILAIEKRVVMFRDDCQEYLIDRKEFEFQVVKK